MIWEPQGNGGEGKGRRSMSISLNHGDRIYRPPKPSAPSRVYKVVAKTCPFKAWMKRLRPTNHDNRKGAVPLSES